MATMPGLPTEKHTPAPPALASHGKLSVKTLPYQVLQRVQIAISAVALTVVQIASSDFTQKAVDVVSSTAALLVTSLFSVIVASKEAKEIVSSTILWTITFFDSLLHSSPLPATPEPSGREKIIFEELFEEIEKKIRVASSTIALTVTLFASLWISDLCKSNTSICSLGNNIGIGKVFISVTILVFLLASKWAYRLTKGVVMHCTNDVLNLQAAEKVRRAKLHIKDKLLLKLLMTRSRAKEEEHISAMQEANEMIRFLGGIRNDDRRNRRANDRGSVFGRPGALRDH